MTELSRILASEKRISPYQAGTFRIALGLFFLLQAFQLGKASDGLLGGFHSFLLGVLAFLLCWGRLRRSAALLLWIVLAWIYLRQPLLEPAAGGLTGLLLLFQVLLPNGEGLQFRQLKASPQWKFPAILFWASWVLLGIYYGWNGIMMCQSPSWVEGSALKEILQSILLDDGSLRRILLRLSEGNMRLFSYAWFALVLAFPFLCLHRKSRPWGWLLMLVAQIFWFLLLNDGMGSLGLVLFQLWIFDPAWFSARKGEAGESLVLYDGVCGLCNGTVQFLLGEDHGKILLFSPLQGKTAEAILGEKSRDNLSSVVYVRNWKNEQSQQFVRSDAVLQLLHDLGGFWKVLSWSRIIPRVFRDLVYRGVAKIRYRLFGRYEFCPLPTTEERQRFLD